MSTYKVLGTSPWRRPDGTFVLPGRTFVATEREDRRIQRRRHYQQRLELVADEDAVVEEEKQEPKKAPDAPSDTIEDIVGGAPSPTPDDVAAKLPQWKLAMSPKRYLRMHPEGPNADLAKALLRKAGEPVPGESEPEPGEDEEAEASEE